MKTYDIKRPVTGEVYLRRYILLSTRFCSVYVHNIRGPDGDEDPHDHPWSFLSLVLSGGYQEERYDVRDSHTVMVRPRWSLARRAAEQIHRIIVVSPNTWTLVVTGPRKREWGFLTPKGWMLWRTYLGITDNRKISSQPFPANPAPGGKP